MKLVLLWVLDRVAHLYLSLVNNLMVPLLCYYNSSGHTVHRAWVIVEYVNGGRRNVKMWYL